MGPGVRKISDREMSLQNKEHLNSTVLRTSGDLRYRGEDLVIVVDNLKTKIGLIKLAQ